MLTATPATPNSVARVQTHRMEPELAELFRTELAAYFPALPTLPGRGPEFLRVHPENRLARAPQRPVAQEAPESPVGDGRAVPPQGERFDRALTGRAPGSERGPRRRPPVRASGRRRRERRQGRDGATLAL